MKSIPPTAIKLIARLDSAGPEQALALRALESELRAARLSFVDVARVLESVADAEKTTGRSLREIADLVKRHWKKPAPGFSGLRMDKKFEFMRAQANNRDLTSADRHRVIEINDRLCLAPGNPVPHDDGEFLDRLFRAAEREKKSAAAFS